MLEEFLDTICQAWWMKCDGLGALWCFDHSIFQHHAIPCGRRLIGANFLLQQDNDPKHSSKLQELFREEAASWYSVYNGAASTVTRSQPYWAAVGAAWLPCPSSQSDLLEVLQEACGETASDYLNKLTARGPKVCKAVIAANGGFFDESKVKIIISNLVNALTIFSIHFAAHLMNNSVH